MTTYRWNTNDAAQAFDAAAQTIHPHYVEIQDQILSQLEQRGNGPLLVVDAGGGSGRLVERVLDRLAATSGVVVDQSEPFLALSAERLDRFGPRAQLFQLRLQDDWTPQLATQADAIVSMSAIHHLTPDEKRSFYSRCYRYLKPGGLLINGDEVRPADDDAYLQELLQWEEHKTQQIATGGIPPAFAETLQKWRGRNIDNFLAPKKSGDDCHETAETQLGYFRDAGFTNAKIPWQRKMWAVMLAEKPESSSP